MWVPRDKWDPSRDPPRPQRSPWPACRDAQITRHRLSLCGTKAWSACPCSMYIGYLAGVNILIRQHPFTIGFHISGEQGDEVMEHGTGEF